MKAIVEYPRIVNCLHKANLIPSALMSLFSGSNGRMDGHFWSISIHNSVPILRPSGHSGSSWSFLGMPKKVDSAGHNNKPLNSKNTAWQPNKFQVLQKIELEEWWEKFSSCFAQKKVPIMTCYDCCCDIRSRGIQSKSENEKKKAITTSDMMTWLRSISNLSKLRNRYDRVTHEMPKNGIRKSKIALGTNWQLQGLKKTKKSSYWT